MIEALLPLQADYWLGLNDFAVEGTFRWVESHQEPSYGNWGHGQPNNSDNQDCVLKQCYSSYNCMWNDFECKWHSHDSKPIHALCQKEK